MGLTGVVLDAVATHTLKDTAADMVERAALCQLLHAAVLLALAERPGRLSGVAKAGLAGGTIELKHIAGLAGLGFLTPYGGACLMAGWVALVLSAIAQATHRPSAA